MDSLPLVSLKAADQAGLCPLCKQELIDAYGDGDVPEDALRSEHYKAETDTYKILRVCREHAALIMIRLWRVLPRVAEDE